MMIIEAGIFNLMFQHTWLGILFLIASFLLGLWMAHMNWFPAFNSSRVPELKKNNQYLRNTLSNLQGDISSAGAAAGATVEAGKAKLTADVDVKAPKVDVDVPDVDVKAPNVDVKAPKVDVDLPDVDVKTPKVDIDVPDVDVKAPDVEVDLPDVDVKAPKVDVDVVAPKVDVDIDAPSVDVDIPSVDVDVDARSMDIDVDVDAPKGKGFGKKLLGGVAAAAAATGAAAAKVGEKAADVAGDAVDAVGDAGKAVVDAGAGAVDATVDAAKSIGSGKPLADLDAKYLEAFGKESVDFNADFGIVYPERPDHADKLSDLDGIGPSMEKKLNELGIYRFLQFTFWDDDQMKGLAKKLKTTVDQMSTDKWVEQAKAKLDA